ncbi:hypothetical protein Vadar_026582 [Vaccinium darrowii]|uniref:Uncharacterized protein n=1 Tax=Vaccinium darrowii TaxID=229202 RepID=A0ACB7YRZ6_9ERIC|nr:hypothetical protein Vadar_026582 [Vaccinium darrowii]
MAFSSCTFTATLRTPLTPLPSLRRSPPHTTLISQFIVTKPLRCSLRLNSSSTIGVNPKKFECKASSSMAETTTEKGKGKVQVFDTEDELAVSLAKYIADLSDKYSKERGFFTVVLSGGSLIKSLRKLAEPPYIDSVDWKKWYVFWVDERVVPTHHEDSNYKLALDGFLSKVPIRSGQIFAIYDGLLAKDAADVYETYLEQLVEITIIDISEATGLPKFDLMLLGMGPDGHVASLFPGHPLVQATKPLVAFLKDSPKPPLRRITFTFPVINSSANIALVVAGASKADAVNVALGNGQSSDLLPVQMVSPEGELTWFLDKEAASKL